MAEVLDDTIIHFGVKGMKWGRRKTEGSTDSAPKAPKKELTPEQKKLRKDLIIATTQIAAGVAIKKGAQWALQNPDKLSNIMQRAENIRNGTKAIGPGYDVVKLTLKNGVFS